LPRTGAPAGGLLALPVLLAYPWLRRRYHSSLKRYFSKIKS